VKRHQVIVTPEVQADIAGSFRFINEDFPLNVARWLIDLDFQIETLECFPERCPLHGRASTTMTNSVSLGGHLDPANGGHQ